MSGVPSRGALAAALTAVLMLDACATPGAAAPPTGAAVDSPGNAPRAAAVHPADPWERWNRRVYAFNDAVDTALIRPLAEGYVKLVPSPLRQAVGNFGTNFGDAWSMVNNLLQGKLEGASISLIRVATNTVFGLGGVIDIASEAGIERRREDLGQTLGHWGVPPGPYLVLPLLGPSTVRDSLAIYPDLYVSPTLITENTAAQVGLVSLYLLDTRAGLLPATRMLDSIALDKYVFVRDAYLQRRLNDVYDGNPPEPADDGDEEGPEPGAPAPAGAPPAPSASSAPSGASSPAAAAPVNSERARVPGQPAPAAAR